MEERLFVAIGFDSEICARLEKEVKKVRINLDKAELGYKWVPGSNYHVTLVFLGNTPAEKKLEIIEKLDALRKEVEAFDLAISGVDAFSSEKEARLVYCGVQNKKALRALVGLIRERLGLSPDESYSPHLTIARLRNQSNVRDIISHLKRRDFLKVRVQEMRLYKSTLAGPFPIYESLALFPFSPKTSIISEVIEAEKSKL